LAHGILAFIHMFLRRPSPSPGHAHHGSGHAFVFDGGSVEIACPVRRSFCTCVGASGPGLATMEQPVDQAAGL